MVKVKIPYTIIKMKELNLTTREWSNYHADSTELKQLIANENNINVEYIRLDDNCLNIIEGELDYNNLDK